MSVDVEDDDEFYERAERGEGTVNVQMWMEGSAVKYHVPDA